MPRTAKKYRFKTSREAVRYLMLTGQWFTEPTMQAAVKRKTGLMFSGSGITARIRELYDEFTVERRPKKGSNSFEYRIPKRIDMERKEAA